MNVLIIGASRGLGLELTRQYLADGARVFATARSEDGLKLLRSEGARVLKLDVTDATSASGLAWQIDGEIFDTVVVNAGVYGPRTNGLETPTEADFDQVMRTNVLGPMRVIPQLVDALADGARLGVISSRMGSMGLRANGSGWLYRASKAAVNSVLKDASFALAGKAICVALHPGWVRTDMGGSDADLDVNDSARDLRRTLAALTPADNGAFLNHDGQPLAW
ncbi:MAG TPA: SDR family oxidoreductase [Ideonella sp.]|uniref:SDR family oxidoreductase n=1 Tax=Ideonella sp. TaxID=1929293 RepID=UPI002E30055E|nr:SDR family oxidoreductase [Ideonella sp.]HEX5686384.1 SDR family oxidoreductase [Ideonella sp.]